VTVAEALETIRRVGAVESHHGKLKLRFPECERAALQPAVETLRSGKAEAIALLSRPDTPDWVSTSATEADGVPWAEWKAAALNRLFQEQGATGMPGRITPATVRHGERMARAGG
jgi:hypothetical protein